MTVKVDLAFPTVMPPRPPDRSLYALESRSRYGLLRRALVFFSGAADVVYSSHHVALMSHNVHVPTSVLVRRLSLVFLILTVVLVDLVFGVKRWLAGVIDGWIHDPLPAPVGNVSQAVNQGDFFSRNLGQILAFGVWMALYGAIYLLLYFLLRRRYQVNVRRLKEMAEGEAAAMKSIYRRHLGEVALDRRVDELSRSLTEQLGSARSLCASKVELCVQAIQGAGAARAAEIIRVREQARLEAMAFEI